MKYIKIIISSLLVILLTGCIGLMGPSEKVDAMLSKYVNLDKTILEELEKNLDEQDLNNEEKTRYENIIKKEYVTMKYEIKDEKIEGDFASVIVDIEVLDLYKAISEAEDDLYENPSKFYTDGVYDSHKFIDYKLSKMEKLEYSTKYTITIILSRHDDIWYIEELSEETLSKIHGIYNYKQK